MNEIEFEKRLEEIVGKPLFTAEENQEEAGTKDSGENVDGKDQTTLTGVPKTMNEAIAQYSALENYPAVPEELD